MLEKQSYITRVVRIACQQRRPATAEGSVDVELDRAHRQLASVVEDGAFLAEMVERFSCSTNHAVEAHIELIRVDSAFISLDGLPIQPGFVHLSNPGDSR